MYLNLKNSKTYSEWLIPESEKDNYSFQIGDSIEIETEIRINNTCNRYWFTKYDVSNQYDIKGSIKYGIKVPDNILLPSTRSSDSTISKPENSNLHNIPIEVEIIWENEFDNVPNINRIIRNSLLPCITNKSQMILHHNLTNYMHKISSYGDIFTDKAQEFFIL